MSERDRIAIVSATSSETRISMGQLIQVRGRDEQQKMSESLATLMSWVGKGSTLFRRQLPVRDNIQSHHKFQLISIITDDLHLDEMVAQRPIATAPGTEIDHFYELNMLDLRLLVA